MGQYATHKHLRLQCAQWVLVTLYGIVYMKAKICAYVYVHVCDYMRLLVVAKLIFTLLKLNHLCYN